MKKIKLQRDGKIYEVDIYFSIFDISGGLLDDNEEIHNAKNTRHALEIYLKGKNKLVPFIRSSDKCCEYCVSPLFIDDGRRYRAGKRVWYKTI